MAFVFCMEPCHAMLVAQLRPALCNPMDYSPPDSSVHGTSQARIPEWGVISNSGHLLCSELEPGVSWVSCIDRWVLGELSL